VIVHEEKPVAAPRNVAGHWSIAGNLNRNLRCKSIAWNIRNFDLSIVIEMCDDDSDRRLDAMSTRLDAIHVRKRGNHSNGPMPAHAKISNAVEKDDSRYTGIVDRSTQQPSNHRVRATRLVYNSAAKVVVLSSKALNAIWKGVVAEFRAATENHTRGLAGSV
jgi:hypothetical protein